MTRNEIINKIFNLSEITYTTGKIIYIDKYSDKCIEISDIENTFFVADLLIFNILILDSGNFETKEVHYFLNSDFYKNENGKRIIFFNKILDNIDQRTKYYNSFSNIKKVFEDFKNKEIRKQKLNKLKEYETYT